MESKQGSSSQTGHEPKWPSVINTLATAGLFYSLPEQLTPGPKWLVPAIVCVLLVLTVAASTKGKLELHFVFGVTMQSMLTVAEAWSLTFLIVTLPAKHQPAAGLMRSAGAIWVSNILIFASWYWRLDAGGPYRRNMRDRHSEGAFLFPQMTVSPESPLAPRSWKP